jgi:adenylosuccinate lyase
MMARTHGQEASPTTVGKEMAIFATRIARQLSQLQHQEFLGKLNGAVGNFNAHHFAHPEVDWIAHSQNFVERLGLTWNPLTTQIESHDFIAELFAILMRIDTILLGFCRDMWSYISIGYFAQKAIAGETGSSVMPHKVNPIDFENAEGNCGVANALLRHFSDKLPISRWQRDLTDSTVLRNLGVALGHTLIAWSALGRGLAKIEADPARMAQDFEAAWEVLGEAVQTVLRAAGVAEGYERLKEFTRGRAIDGPTLAAFIDALPLAANEKTRLRALTPAQYTGLAARLAREI